MAKPGPDDILELDVTVEFAKKLFMGCAIDYEGRQYQVTVLDPKPNGTGVHLRLVPTGLNRPG